MPPRDAAAVPAGRFTTWLGEIGRALSTPGEAGADVDVDVDVPCGDCTACCRSAQFVHVAADETDTLAHVPAELLFPAPGLPDGSMLLGYDERGHCPMLVDDRCSIYAHRPRACRTYDCRVYAAAGVDISEERPLVAERARRWRFDEDDAGDRARHDAVRAAATYLAEHPETLPTGAGRPTGTRLALMAVAAHEHFLAADAATGRLAVVEPGPTARIVG